MRRQKSGNGITYTETDNTHDDHGQDVRPGHLCPVAERWTLVERAVSVRGVAVLALVSPLARRHDGASGVLLACSADRGGGIGVWRGRAAVEEAHAELDASVVMNSEEQTYAGRGGEEVDVLAVSEGREGKREVQWKNELVGNKK